MMQKIAATSSLSVYYDDLLYLESALSVAAEDNPSLVNLAIKAQKTKQEITDLQDEEKKIHENVVKKRARGKYFDGDVDKELLQAGMTMEQATNRDYSHPEYKMLFEKYSASEMVKLGITRENHEVRSLLQRSQALLETHPFRTKHYNPISTKLEKSEKADQEYKEAQQKERVFYAGVTLRKAAWNKDRREIYVALEVLFPHDKDFVESFFSPIKASEADEEDTPEQALPKVQAEDS